MTCIAHADRTRDTSGCPSLEDIADFARATPASQSNKCTKLEPLALAGQRWTLRLSQGQGHTLDRVEADLGVAKAFGSGDCSSIQRANGAQAGVQAEDAGVACEAAAVQHAKFNGYGAPASSAVEKMSLPPSHTVCT